MRDLLKLAVFVYLTGSSFAFAFDEQVQPLVDAACISCHDADTKTALNFDSLGKDLSDPSVFRSWERVFDRVDADEMPPKSQLRPDGKLRKAALLALRQSLLRANQLAQAKFGRVPLRRLTRIEYEYTLHDLLGIRNDLAKHLPPENDQAQFDTVSSAQGISPVHIRSYLRVADLALDEAIKLGPTPSQKPRELNYAKAKYVKMWFDRPLRRGGNTIMPWFDGVVTFDSRPHVLRSDYAGYRPKVSGLYRIKMEVFAYEAKTPVVMTLLRGNRKVDSTDMFGAFDLLPDERKKVTAEVYLTPDNFFFPGVSDLDADASGKGVFSAGGAIREGGEKFRGEGVGIASVTIEGPLESIWPPARTRRLLRGVNIKKRSVEGGGHDFHLQVAEGSEIDELTAIVDGFALRAFRRPLIEGETEPFIALGKAALAESLGFEHAARVSLRALLSSPNFLFRAEKPGRLDSYAVANRLSYFLWKSLPDDYLLSLAEHGDLSKSTVLAEQVDRMLDDPKSSRFIRDFLGQWLGLKNIDATTPDSKLYPEYDDVLRRAMLSETENFFHELVRKDLPVRSLIDSDFAFLNRRLAEHYGIEGVVGDQFRKVILPPESVRGGVLTQASILKVTANGTVTSPVKRGAFVLTSLLGSPPRPPPPDIGSIEPDTRGTTTIRETLAAHRRRPKCVSCHESIDPPGFALESFDPIGGFRTRYRSTDKGDRPKRKFRGRGIFEYRDGPRVDASGVTPERKPFSGIQEYKKLLLTREKEIARSVVSKLLVYATGGEIEFADRVEVDRIVERLEASEYGMRSLIHLIVQSPIFLSK